MCWKYAKIYYCCLPFIFHFALFVAFQNFIVLEKHQKTHPLVHVFFRDNTPTKFVGIIVFKKIHSRDLGLSNSPGVIPQHCGHEICDMSQMNHMVFRRLIPKGEQKTQHRFLLRCRFIEILLKRN